MHILAFISTLAKKVFNGPVKNLGGEGLTQHVMLSKNTHITVRACATGGF
jgi:hypothetical protein